MISSQNAKLYSVGSLIGTPTVDDDHIRGRLAVHDADTIAAMEAGKTQVSMGYTCDTLETPGVHPVYGPYDAIQKNIRGDCGGHVAIVDRARAGVTASARMDGWQVVDDLQEPCQHVIAMADLPTARVELVLRTDKMVDDKRTGVPAEIDPNDLAHRSAAGQTNAKPVKKLQPGRAADRSGDVVRGAEPAAGSVPVDGHGQPADYPSQRLQDDDDPDDAYDMSYCDGELTQAARDKIKASNFAAPDSEKLPIHDKPHVKAAMSRFGQTDFKNSDEKHAAFNRIVKRAKDFGVNPEGFVKAHGGKLDRADDARSSTQEEDMTAEELKALQARADKADERKNKLEVARARIDGLVADVAERDAKIHDLTKQLEAAKAARADGADADKLIAERADAKIALIDEARATGAKVDSKMSVAEIKRAVVKHVDGDDVPADAHEKFLDGVYSGALKRAKKDAADTTAGAQALGAARAAVQAAVAGTAQQHLDAGGDEEAAKRALATSNREAIRTPSLAKTRLANVAR